MKKIVILSNNDMYTYNFRLEIIKKLLENNKVFIVMPRGEFSQKLEKIGCIIIDIRLDRRGKNPIKDFVLLVKYFRIMRNIKPLAVLSYTIKPNLYGGIASRLLKISFFPNVTGLGTSINDKITSYFIKKLYKISFNHATTVFVQNQDSVKYLSKIGIDEKKIRLIPGSGVNVDKFQLLEYPNNSVLKFLYASRVMKEKGINEFLNAAEIIKAKYSNIEFNIIGYCEQNYLETINKLVNRGVINYHGLQHDVVKFYSESHCILHPSFYPEGVSNVLLESASSGRPIITTDNSGCKEVVDDGINGFIVPMRNTQILVEAIERFINLSYEEKREMGIKGRRKIINKYDRRIIVDAYEEEVEKKRN